MSKEYLKDRPELLEEWDYESNSKDPMTLTTGSSYYAKWNCKTCGGKWGAKIKNRAINNTGCPFCSNRRVLPGFNDLETIHPDLAEEYSDKNELPASQIIRGGKKKFIWTCKVCGNDWLARVDDRISGCGCSFCAGKTIKAGFNDLASVHPDWLDEWDYDANKAEGVYPDKIAPASNKNVHWICQKCGHKYIMPPNRRRAGSRCKACAGKPVAGINDLLTTHLSLVKTQWDFDKNERQPSEFTIHSKAKVWWKCPKCNDSFTRPIYLIRKSPLCLQCSRADMANKIDLSSHFELL